MLKQFHVIFQQFSKETLNYSSCKIGRIDLKMAQYTNSTPRSDDWELYLQPIPYIECLVVLIILLIGLKIQLQRFKQQQNVNIIKEIGEGVVHVFATVTDWCALMQDYDDTIPMKQVIKAQVTPYPNKTAVQPERREDNQDPRDLVKKMMVEQQQAAIAVKWVLLPLEMLMDEQFLAVLHTIEEITDIAPLREASLQLPKKIYEIIRVHKQLA